MQTPPTGNPQSRPGNDNAAGAHRVTPDPVAVHQASLTGLWPRLQRRNWGGTASAPSLYGSSASVDRQAVGEGKDPFRVSGPAGARHFATAEEAAAFIERRHVEIQDEQRAARLQHNPLADPEVARAALRALRLRPRPLVQ